jgi:hypothetical protein
LYFLPYTQPSLLSHQQIDNPKINNMIFLRTAVLLFSYPAGTQRNIFGDRTWYQNYFFNQSYGMAGYWLKQSGTEISLDGEVFDWAFVDDPNPVLNDRSSVLTNAIGYLERDRGINFTHFDIVIMVIDAPVNVPVNAGAAWGKSSWRSHPGAILRPGGPFDFNAHEVGHTIGLNHSYGSPYYKNIDWSQYGEYGHPYCVMSAMGYGGMPHTYTPPVPRDGQGEYASLGPSINAGTALARGWLDAHVFHLPGASFEMELRSRHWLGKIPGYAPQALELIAPDGKTYVVEYRENEDWDKGLGSPLLIINAVKGSTADVAHPNTHSATFLGKIGLPLNFGYGSNIFNGPGFGLEVLDRSPGNHLIRIRVSSGRVGITFPIMNKVKETLNETVVETGETKFVPGEKFCVEGTWPYQKIEVEEKWTLEFSYPPILRPFNVIWHVDGNPLEGVSGQLVLTSKLIKLADPKRDDLTVLQTVTLHYEMEELPTGSRLHLFNRSSSQIFELLVTATITSTIGSGRREEWIDFVGTKFIYPTRYYEVWAACFKESVPKPHQFIQDKIVLDPIKWTGISEELINPVEQKLDLLSRFYNDGNISAYNVVLNDLATLTNTPIITPVILKLGNSADLNPQLGEREMDPPAPSDWNG